MQDSLRNIQVPLTQSKYVLAKYGIQVIDPQADTEQDEEVLPSMPEEAEPDDVHHHPGPRAMECKTNAGKFSCDRDSWMRLLWCYLFPCALLELCIADCCDRCWDCLGACLRRMEEHYTFQCCNYCCKIEEV